MPVGDPVIERIAAHPWPRGGVQARRVWSGYTLMSARSCMRPRPCHEGPPHRWRPQSVGMYEISASHT